MGGDFVNWRAEHPGGMGGDMQEGDCVGVEYVSEEGESIGVGCSGEGGKGGSFRRSLYCLVCFGRFGLDDGGSGPYKSDLLLRVLTMH